MEIHLSPVKMQRPLNGFGYGAYPKKYMKLPEKIRKYIELIRQCGIMKLLGDVA